MGVGIGTNPNEFEDIRKLNRVRVLLDRYEPQIKQRLEGLPVHSIHLGLMYCTDFEEATRIFNNYLQATDKIRNGSLVQKSRKILDETDSLDKLGFNLEGSYLSIRRGNREYEGWLKTDGLNVTSFVAFNIECSNLQQ